MTLSTDRFAGGHDGQVANSPAKVAGDRDEAKDLPDDIAVDERGGPDADTHYPAAATSVADEEAGTAPSPEGRIEPLEQARRPPGWKAG